MIKFISVRELNSIERKQVYDEFEFKSVLSTLSNYIQHINNNPKEIEVCYEDLKDGSGYRKFLQIPLPKLCIDFEVENPTDKQFPED